MVITDLKMPGKDGITLLREIKEYDPDISVILLTGQGSIETAVEAMKIGAYDYITKPEDTKLKYKPCYDKAVKFLEELDNENKSTTNKKR